MATDPNAKELIKTLTLSRKSLEAKEAIFTKKFILGNAVPTETDVENLEKLVEQMKKAAGLMHKDIEEISATVRTFGGLSDTTIRNAEETLTTLKSKVH
jgi:hypothetical protein